MNRFTISLDEQLARQFETLIRQKRYVSRSEAVRDLIRYGLGRAGLGGMAFDRAVTSCIAHVSYVYDTRELALASRLLALRHAHHGMVIACHQTPLDHGSCMECVVLRGPVAAVHDLSDALVSLRGVRHGHANVVALMDDAVPHAHAHALAHPHSHQSPLN
ncbi:nickel-responsive transcriptional regulator NikR [Variovorax paradoxus]|uniref:nickel-responsive transcriptional regulator NikR n=1 Tax=Variovorax paradoxus TaxID=34073 RepID=UPI0005AC3F0D|nr:nickel-responsive transcriptional regulator NikR [Variovorax paradoxus]